MNRWKSFLLNHWRAKIVSLAAATLVWLVLRHAIAPSPATAVRLALAFAGSGVEKLAVVFPSYYVEF